MKNDKNKNPNPTPKFYQFYLICIILFCTLFSYQIAFASSIAESDLANLLNQERSSHNLHSLHYNQKLSLAAQNKANYMIENNYFEHYAPDGTSPWYFFKSAGYTYKLAGENLAMDFSTAKAVTDAWMASPTHKENILNPEYIDYGFAVKDGKINGEPTTVVVELFGKPDQTILDKAGVFVNYVLNLILGFK